MRKRFPHCVLFNFRQTSLAAIALTASLGAAACDNDAPIEDKIAAPVTVKTLVQEILPALINSTNAAAHAFEESAQWTSLLDSLDSFGALGASVFGEEEDSFGPVPTSHDEDGDLDGQDLADQLIEELFNEDNYLGNGDYAIPGELICRPAEEEAYPSLPGESDDPELVIDQECLDTVSLIDPRFHVVEVGAGLDLTLVIGPDRSSPLAFELRTERITAVADFGQAKAAAEYIASVVEEEIEVPLTVDGTIAATLLANGPDDVSFEFAVREAIEVAGSLTDIGAVSFSLAASDPTFALRIGADQELNATLDLKQTQLTVPWEMFDESDIANTLALDWSGLSASLAWSENEEEFRFSNIGFGDGQSTIAIDDQTVFSLDLNADSGRHFDLSVSDVGSGLPVFAFAPKMNLDLFFDLSSIAADEDLEVPAFLLRGETYSIDIDGSGPAVQPVEGLDEDALKVVSGQLSISSDSGLGTVQVAAGQCLLTSNVEPEEHELLGLFAAGSCPE